MAVNRERKMVSRQKDYIDLDYLSLGAVKNSVDSLFTKYGKDAKVVGQSDPYSDSDRVTYYVYVEEPETDKEMNKRIEQEEKWLADREERERRDYEALKAKFEGKDK